MRRPDSPAQRPEPPSRQPDSSARHPGAREQPRASRSPSTGYPTPRARRRPSRRVYIRRRIVVGVAACLILALVVGGSVFVSSLVSLATGLHRSALSGVTQNTGESNILVMGLDSRLDENGDPLPAKVYDALHAGTAADGGYNTNVLMLIHIPAGGGQAVGISIPRDDYVALPGSPDGISHGKIKQAYGLMLDQTDRSLAKTQPNLSLGDRYQKARAAARQETVTAVSQFLGGVPIDHFIEVTMAAFYQLAVAVQPVTVCLNHATSDTYSGADFRAGVQQLTASEAVSFVRQRRDTGNGPDLTDLDRERRQQAFIISLATKLRHEDVFTNIPLMQQLIDTAKQNIAIDSGFDLLSFASVAKRLAAGNLTFHTLPITGYATRDGQDVNLVDLPAIRAQVKQLIAASNGSATAPPAPAPTTAHSTGGHATAPPAPKAAPSSAPGSMDPAPITSGGIPCVN